jgi:hypothetical protein
MDISCVILRVFMRLDNTRYRAALAHYEDRTSIHKSLPATTSSRLGVNSHTIMCKEVQRPIVDRVAPTTSRSRASRVMW